MNKEILNLERPEILFFGEGVADQIKKGSKLVTIRLFGEGIEDPNIDMPEGTDFLASCRDDNQKIPTKIIHNKEMPLKSINPLLLGLDGYFSNDKNDAFSAAKVAAADLQQYYPERQVTLETPVKVIMFVTDDVLKQFSKENQIDFCKMANDSPIKLFQEERFKGVFKNISHESNRVDLD